MPEDGQPAGQPRTPGLTGLRILLVDDDEMSRFAGRHLLGLGGALVVTANDGAEALRWVADGGFDLVLMDMAMPVMDGLTAVAAIRGDLGVSPETLPIAALTATDTPEQRATVAAAGLVGLIRKPLDPKTFRNEVAALMQGRHPTDAARAEAERDAELLTRFAATFLTTQREELNRIATHLAAGDLESVARIAHRTKGTGATFGFPEIGELGQRLETAARTGATAEVARLAAQLRERVEQSGP